MASKTNMTKLKKQERRQREDISRLKALIPNETRMDDGWGTIKPDKTEMEEARILVCPECGSSGGRHISLCSRA